MMQGIKEIRGFVFMFILTTGLFICSGSSSGATPQVSAGDYHTVGLKTDGTVVAVGDNGSGQTLLFLRKFHTNSGEFRGHNKYCVPIMLPTPPRQRVNCLFDYLSNLLNPESTAGIPHRVW